MKAQSQPLLLALALGVALTAHAQTTTPVAGTFGTAKGAAVRTADDGPPSSRDPRVCLEFPTREQVIACAEKYRPGKHRAKS
jgi:hypothetical protein